MAACAVVRGDLCSMLVCGMIRLPVSLERRLDKLFPRAADKNRFVTEAVSSAIEEYQTENDTDGETFVGGTLHLFTDGGSRGNPGQAAVGAILEDPVRGTVLREHYERIGIETNNVAEYRALIEGLKIAKRFHPNRLICHLDSELIVKQLNGEYRIKMEFLRSYVDEIRELSENFADITFVHIPRSDNHRADALVNKALDEHPSPKYEKP